MGEHPTAIIGIIAAADNTKDCVGIVPVAQIVFASGSTGTTLSAGEAFSRLMLLGVQLVRGDVLNMSMGIPVPSAGTTVMMPVEVQRVIVSALRMLTFRGITCMIAAGNSTLNLDNPPFPFTNSGSIMVGIEPTNQRAGDDVQTTSDLELRGAGRLLQLGLGGRVAHVPEPSKPDCQAVHGGRWRNLAGVGHRRRRRRGDAGPIARFRRKAAHSA